MRTRHPYRHSRKYRSRTFRRCAVNRAGWKRNDKRKAEELHVPWWLVRYASRYRSVPSKAPAKRPRKVWKERVWVDSIGGTAWR